ncbi:restriction endonuclease [Lottiidibacillus patelloidae]|uniref:Restriction endonuclease n=1 Tax=Lottiidibacillus patelloidae TaxID=2670334 RepID=A0A263BT08_9BACI|nr:HNH endonuclease [Lottiidibacillus patelloidae]OZM56844.1 restriction endonuclease [Lottiidibacillus patelloidae]
MKNVCELCERENIETTVHHLIPREEGGNYGPTANLCAACHKQIHALFTNKELASYLHTIQDLKNNEKMRKFLKWIKKQPSTASVKIKKSNERKKKRK